MFPLLRFSYCFVLIAIFSFAGIAQAKIKVIFDTDIGSDCDDAGALAVLHKLADDGLIEILATIHSSRTDTSHNRYGAGALDAINTYYGRPDIRIGVSRETDVGDGEVQYVREVALDQKRYGHDILTADQAEDMIDVYVDLMRTHDDIVIVTVGHPIALWHLLDRGHGPLIEEKVKSWFAMGMAVLGSPENSLDYWYRDWNFGANGMRDFVGELLEKWPAPFYLSPAGNDIETGNELLAKYDEINPVRRSYRVWLDWFNPEKNERNSWDQIALIAAAVGEGEWFSFDSSGAMEYRDDEQSFLRWNLNAANPLHHRVILNTTPEEMRAIVEEYMVRPPLFSDAPLPMDRYFAWCVVPFDEPQRSPEARIEMLKGLGFDTYAYDWRVKDLEDTARELQLAKEAGVNVNSVWMWFDGRYDTVEGLNEPNERLFQIVEETGYTGELWISFNDNFFADLDEGQSLKKSVEFLDYVAGRANDLGLKLGLYNHGGWFGDPRNQVRIIEALPEREIGIVYNFHHAHDQLADYKEIAEAMLPHLYAVNINGMRSEGPKILTLGEGYLERKMMNILLEMGYEGEFGVLGHVHGVDVEGILTANLQGLRNLGLLK